MFSFLCSASVLTGCIIWDLCLKSFETCFYFQFLFFVSFDMSLFSDLLTNSCHDVISLRLRTWPTPLSRILVQLFLNSFANVMKKDPDFMILGFCETISRSKLCEHFQITTVNDIHKISNLWATFILYWDIMNNNSFAIPPWLTCQVEKLPFLHKRRNRIIKFMNFPKDFLWSTLYNFLDKETCCGLKNPNNTELLMSSVAFNFTFLCAVAI